jgi:hypothetical protein
MAITFNGNDLTVPGNLNVGGTLSLPDDFVTSSMIDDDAVARATMMITESSRPHHIPLTDLVRWDAPADRLPAAGTSDDLGYYNGTFGTEAPAVQTQDVKNLGAQTLYARFQCRLPAEYVQAGGLVLQLLAGMKTTIASVSATIDVEFYKINPTTGAVSGSDLVLTVAQSINSTTLAAKSFTIDDSLLSPGDKYDCRITIAVNDSGTGTAVIGKLSDIALLAGCKG